MAGFASMARQAAATAATFNQPRQQVTRTTSGVGGASIRNIRSLFSEAQRLYAPGGEYMEGTEAELRRGQKLAVASGMQNLAASGMAGTSMAGNLGQMYEEDIAAPTRARATTARIGALSGILQAAAGAEANLATRYSTTISPGARGGGGYAPSTPSDRRAATTTPAARKVPTLSAFPSLTGARRPSGRATGTGVQPMMVSRADPMNVNRVPGTFRYYDV